MFWNDWDRLWDIEREFDDLRRELDRVFGPNDRPDSRSLPFSRFSFLPGRSARRYPLINLSEDENAVKAQALAPGLDPARINVSVVRNQLSISGQKEAPPEDARPEQYHRSERAAGAFTRTVTLPVEIDADKVQAEYRNGILFITMPKAEHSRPRQIAVSVE
jgi:HSP20 family protein